MWSSVRVKIGLAYCSIACGALSCIFFADFYGFGCFVIFAVLLIFYPQCAYIAQILFIDINCENSTKKISLPSIYKVDTYKLCFMTYNIVFRFL